MFNFPPIVALHTGVQTNHVSLVQMGDRKKQKGKTLHESASWVKEGRVTAQSAAEMGSAPVGTVRWESTKYCSLENGLQLLWHMPQVILPLHISSFKPQLSKEKYS